MTDVEHGEASGVSWHKKHGEILCDRCRAYDNDYMRRYRQTPKGKEGMQRQKRRDKARRRAYVRLSALYPEDTNRLFDEELAKIEQEET